MRIQNESETIKLYRYELFSEDEQQEVGFCVGLEDINLPEEVVDYLLKPFDDYLAIPDLPEMQDSVSFFTEEGKEKFKHAIQELSSAYKGTIFDVVEISLDLPTKYAHRIIYEDENQVCIPGKLYYDLFLDDAEQKLIVSGNIEEAVFPIINPLHIGNLYHVGSMDITKKNDFSCEGNGLSISNCPDSWIRITEGLTHGDIFELEKDDLKLLDYYSLTALQKQEIRDWAIQNDFVTEGTGYKHFIWDEEGKERFSLFATYEEALAEAEEWGEASIKPCTCLFPTQKLLYRALVQVNLIDIPSWITELYADKVLDYDGVYWNEELNEANDSAPRGVVFNRKLPEFEITNLSREMPRGAIQDKIAAAVNKS